MPFESVKLDVRGAKAKKPMPHKQLGSIFLCIVAGVWSPSLGVAQLPESGLYVPELDVFDQAMQNFMQTNGIEAGVLGVMKNGNIVYLRGFGWRDHTHTTPLPENAMMRLASVTKPVTAAGIQKLIDARMIDPLDFAFSLQQPAPGLLEYDPFGGLGDSRLRSITVQHLLTHTGGWDRAVAGDLTYREIRIASDMNVISPPGRVNTVRWIMGQPLQYNPGTPPCDNNGNPPGCYAGTQYSNIGYLLLGLILEQESGMDYISFIRRHVLTESMWFPASEFELGRTFPADRNLREPWYDEDAAGINVFDPYTIPNFVRRPDGSWDHEARVGQGALIASAVPLLHYLETYTVNNPNIGAPLTQRILRNHGGSLAGTNTLARQRPDGVNYVLLVNKRNLAAGGVSYSTQFLTGFDAVLDAGGISWPASTVDGTWFDFAYGGVEEGSYNRPYNSMDDLRPSNVGSFSKVRIKESSSRWTGVIDQPNLRLMTLKGEVATIGL